MNIKDFKSALSDSGVETPEIELRIILEDIAGIKPIDWVGNKDIELSPDIIQKILSIIERRIKGEPLGRILGYRDFWKSRFYLSADTLEPRPDTETLIEAVLNDNKAPKTILDIGTGTGCILLSLLQEYPQAIGTGIDVSAGACATARANAERLGLSERVTFLNGSWFEPILGGARFDVIVSNPPYIPTNTIRNLDKNVKNHDPILALDGGDDGLNPYKILLPNLKNVLEVRGAAYFEFGVGQANDISRLAEDAGATLIRVLRDLGGMNG